MVNPYKKFGEFLKQVRKEAGLTQWDTANELGLKSPQYISNIERGLNGISIEHIGIISKLYGVPVKLVVDFYMESEVNRIKTKIDSKYGSIEGVA